MTTASEVYDLPPGYFAEREAERSRADRPGLRDRLLDRAQLSDLPQPEPLIDDTLDRRTVALLVGPWGIGKSFLALDWAACVATGKPWQGRPVKPGRVLYVAAEGAWGLDQRLTAWEYAWRHQIPADRLNVLPVAVNLTDRRDAVPELAELARGHGLVIVDTVAKCSVGAEENSVRDMGVVVDALYQLRDATDGGTILAVHHTGKDGTTRGSTSLPGGVDTIYQLTGDSRLLRLSREKRKDGPPDDTLSLRLDTVLDSVVVVSAMGADIKPKSNELLSIFVSSFSATGASKAELRAAANMPPATFHRALNDLLEHGFLINKGSDTRPFYILGVTP